MFKVVFNVELCLDIYYTKEKISIAIVINIKGVINSKAYMFPLNVVNLY